MICQAGTGFLQSTGPWIGSDRSDACESIPGVHREGESVVITFRHLKEPGRFDYAVEWSTGI